MQQMGTVVPPPPVEKSYQGADGVMQAAPGTAAPTLAAPAAGYGMYPYNSAGAAAVTGAGAASASAAAGMVYQPTRVAGASAAVGGGGSLQAGAAAAARLPQHDGPDGGGAAELSDGEELLGDDDDDDDSDDEEIENFIIAQCDRNKIRRKTDKYNIAIRDGIMRLNDTEYMFSKLEGRFVWMG